MEIIIGAAVSLLTQAIKKWFGTDTLGTYTAVLCLSLAGGAAYFVLDGWGAWNNVLHIIEVSGSIYVFVIRRFE